MSMTRNKSQDEKAKTLVAECCWHISFTHMLRMFVPPCYKVSYSEDIINLIN